MAASSAKPASSTMMSAFKEEFKTQFFPLEQLKKECPAGVDLAKK